MLFQLKQLQKKQQYILIRLQRQYSSHQKSYFSICPILNLLNIFENEIHIVNLFVDNLIYFPTSFDLIEAENIKDTRSFLDHSQVYPVDQCSVA